MVENLDKLLQRDGKIEIIASKAEQLSTSSNTYRKNVSTIVNNRVTLGTQSEEPDEKQTYLPCHYDLFGTGNSRVLHRCYCMRWIQLR